MKLDVQLWSCKFFDHFRIFYVFDKIFSTQLGHRGLFWDRVLYLNYTYIGYTGRHWNTNLYQSINFFHEFLIILHICYHYQNLNHDFWCVMEVVCPIGVKASGRYYLQEPLGVVCIRFPSKITVCRRSFAAQFFLKKYFLKAAF